MVSRANRHCEKRTIFVDASGRRLRRLRVVVAIVVVPAVAYVGALLSTLLVGLVIHLPALPSVAPPQAAAAPAHSQPVLADPAQLFVANVTLTQRFKGLAVGKVTLARKGSAVRMVAPVGKACLLYTSDAADEEDSVDLG